MTVRSSGKHSIIKSLTKDQLGNKGEDADLLDFNLDLQEQDFGFETFHGENRGLDLIDRANLDL